MKTECSYLFVYGTLLSGDNEMANFLKINSEYVCKGSFNGRLYDLGDYPGALYQPDCIQSVHGDILLLKDSIYTLNLLDNYEDFNGNEDDPANLYIRRIVPGKTDTGIIQCWVYLYHQPIKGYPQIMSGRYLK